MAWTIFVFGGWGGGGGGNGKEHRNYYSIIGYIQKLFRENEKEHGNNNLEFRFRLKVPDFAVHGREA